MNSALHPSPCMPLFFKSKLWRAIYCKQARSSKVEKTDLLLFVWPNQMLNQCFAIAKNEIPRYVRPFPLCLTANLPIRASCRKQDWRVFRCPAYNKSLIFVTSLAELTIANGAGIYQRSYSYISFDIFTLTSVNPTDSPSFSTIIIIGAIIITSNIIAGIK